jgi:hypothetical protein
MYRYLILFFSIILFITCSPTKQGQSTVDDGASRNVGTTQAISEVKTDNSALQLVDYLRRIPGVQVSGSKNDRKK